MPHVIKPPYIHLRPEEITSLEAWMKSGLMPDFIDYSFDVRVGKGIEPPPDIQEPWRSMWLYLTKRRIDLLGWTKDSVWIIELKGRADLAGIGQLLGYRELIKTTYKVLPENIVLAYVAYDFPTDVRDSAQRLGIKVYDVSPWLES